MSDSLKMSVKYLLLSTKKVSPHKKKNLLVYFFLFSFKKNFFVIFKFNLNNYSYEFYLLFNEIRTIY